MLIFYEIHPVAVNWPLLGFRFGQISSSVRSMYGTVSETTKNSRFAVLCYCDVVLLCCCDVVVLVFGVGGAGSVRVAANAG